ncbi:MAG: universal stress protein [Archangiaceae bacterium]|nr:universal stress protein [Archangiaceae bacterium]
MPLPMTIAVATDFSETADKAVKYAVELARKLDARVHLVHAWAIPVVSYPDMLVPLPAGLIDDIAIDAQNSMDAALKRHTTPGIKLEGTVVCGDARDAVLAAAEKAGANLLVVGTHGRTGLKRAVMGSVAEYLVRHSGVPVLVVR